MVWSNRFQYFGHGSYFRYTFSSSSSVSIFIGIFAGMSQSHFLPVIWFWSADITSHSGTLITQLKTNKKAHSSCPLRLFLLLKHWTISISQYCVILIAPPICNAKLPGLYCQKYSLTWLDSHMNLSDIPFLIHRVPYDQRCPWGLGVRLWESLTIFTSGRMPGSQCPL